MVIVVASTNIPTATPTPTLVPTSTVVPTATPTPTLVPTPTVVPTPAPVRGVMTGDVFLHEGPAENTARLGTVVRHNELVEILAVTGGWYRVRWVSSGHAEVIGWTPAEWVGTGALIPAGIVTPVTRP